MGCSSVGPAQLPVVEPDVLPSLLSDERAAATTRSAVKPNCS